jgi:enoyl-CoA hydratase/carnithine racemase
MSKTVLYEKKGKIGIISLNRPDVHNAINHEMNVRILEVLAEVKEDDVTVAILRGNGRSFCAGADIKEGARGVIDNYARAQMAADRIRLIANLTKPIIASVKGYALGGGLETALACDMIMASEDAKFGFPETKVGTVVADGTTQHLPRLIGMFRAKELIYTSRVIDAKEAEAWGMVNRVVPTDQLEKTTMEMAETIASMDPLVVRLHRLCLDGSADGSFEAALKLETLAFLTVLYSGSREKGMAEKLEQKRKK